MKMNRYVKISTVMMLSKTCKIFTSISKIAIVQVMVFTVSKVKKHIELHKKIEMNTVTI